MLTMAIADVKMSAVLLVHSIVSIYFPDRTNICGSKVGSLRR